MKTTNLNLKQNLQKNHSASPHRKKNNLTIQKGSLLLTLCGALNLKHWSGFLNLVSSFLLLMITFFDVEITLLDEMMQRVDMERNISAQTFNVKQTSSLYNNIVL